MVLYRTKCLMDVISALTICNFFLNSGYFVNRSFAIDISQSKLIKIINIFLILFDEIFNLKMTKVNITNYYENYTYICVF